MCNFIEPLVSIIMPAYNAEKYLDDSIKSVMNQTYKNWELLIVDDCSTDNTCSLIRSYSESDDRIKAFELSYNQGAAKARNFAIEKARGGFIAFLDIDDVWEITKLTKQIQWMRQNNIYFSCTYYGKINEHGEKLNQTVLYSNKVNYNGLLKNCPGNSTVIYNSDKIGKFYISNIRKRNDYLMWLQVIKVSKYLYCFEEELSYHRVVSSSLSSRKSSLVKYHWHVYRKEEQLSLVKSIILLLYWIFKGIKINFFIIKKK